MRNCAQRRRGKLSFATGDHSFFPTITANDHKWFYKMQFPLFNEKRYEALMEFFELPTNKKISEFSLGQQNQFEVVLAISQGAEYIIMDEPFAGNDVFNREDFYYVDDSDVEEFDKDFPPKHKLKLPGQLF